MAGQLHIKGAAAHQSCLAMVVVWSRLKPRRSAFDANLRQFFGGSFFCFERLCADNFQSSWGTPIAPRVGVLTTSGSNQPSLRITAAYDAPVSPKYSVTASVSSSRSQCPH